MANRTIIAFDFGTTCIGMAICQEIIGHGRALTSCKAHHGVPDWQKIDTVFREWRPDLQVVGLPLNMDGSEQLLSEHARKFARRLQGRFAIQTILHDERLTTVEARARLFSCGGYRALGKEAIDATSAVIILESWLAAGAAV